MRSKLFIAFLFAACVAAIAQVAPAQPEPLGEPSPQDLITPATTPLRPEAVYPALPSLSTAMRGHIVEEMNEERVRRAFERLNPRRDNNECFEAVDILEKEKAEWSLQACLVHPSEDVQIRALLALGRLRSENAVPFLFIYGHYMAVHEAGSENATIHGIIHRTLAQTLSTITGVEVSIEGQDPEGLERGLLKWTRWLLDQRQEQARNLEVEFEQIASGHHFERDSGDRLYSAVIWDAEGYGEFLERYRLPVDGLKLPFDGNRVYVVGFSDDLATAFCDGVSHRSRPDSPYYYLDLNDTGVKFNERMPPEGMKYSSWVLVSIPRPEGIAHVQVREGVVGKLSEQFGDSPHEKAEQAGAGDAAAAAKPDGYAFLVSCSELTAPAFVEFLKSKKIDSWILRVGEPGTDPAGPNRSEIYVHGKELKRAHATVEDSKVSERFTLMPTP